MLEKLLSDTAHHAIDTWNYVTGTRKEYLAAGCEAMAVLALSAAPLNYEKYPYNLLLSAPFALLALGLSASRLKSMQILRKIKEEANYALLIKIEEDENKTRKAGQLHAGVSFVFGVLGAQQYFNYGDNMLLFISASLGMHSLTAYVANISHDPEKRKNLVSRIFKREKS